MSHSASVDLGHPHSNGHTKGGLLGRTRPWTADGASSSSRMPPGSSSGGVAVSTGGGLGFGSLSGSSSTTGGGPGVQRGLKLTKEAPKDGFGKRESMILTRGFKFGRKSATTGTDDQLQAKDKPSKGKEKLKGKSKDKRLQDTAAPGDVIDIRAPAPDEDEAERTRLREMAAHALGVHPLMNPSETMTPTTFFDDEDEDEADYEEAQRQRLEDAPNDSSADGDNIPPFPTHLQALKTFSQLSGTYPKYYPPSSLRIFALSRNWKSRHIVFTSPPAASRSRALSSSHSKIRVSYLHLFKSPSPFEKEVERLEINEDSVIFVSEDEVGGKKSGSVVKVGGRDVGAMRKEYVFQEDGRALWFLCMEDLDIGERHRWIAGIKNAVLGQRTARAGQVVPAHFQGNEPRGDMDVMLTIRTQGLLRSLSPIASTVSTTDHTYAHSISSQSAHSQHTTTTTTTTTKLINGPVSAIKGLFSSSNGTTGRPRSSSSSRPQSGSSSRPRSGSWAPSSSSTHGGDRDIADESFSCAGVGGTSGVSMRSNTPLSQMHLESSSVVGGFQPGWKMPLSPPQAQTQTPVQSGSRPASRWGQTTLASYPTMHHHSAERSRDSTSSTSSTSSFLHHRRYQHPSSLTREPTGSGEAVTGGVDGGPTPLSLPPTRKRWSSVGSSTLAHAMMGVPIGPTPPVSPTSPVAATNPPLRGARSVEMTSTPMIPEFDTSADTTISTSPDAIPSATTNPITSQWRDSLDLPPEDGELAKTDLAPSPIEHETLNQSIPLARRLSFVGLDPSSLSIPVEDVAASNPDVPIISTTSPTNTPTIASTGTLTTAVPSSTNAALITPPINHPRARVVSLQSVSPSTYSSDSNPYNYGGGASLNASLSGGEVSSMSTKRSSTGSGFTTGSGTGSRRWSRGLQYVNGERVLPMQMMPPMHPPPPPPTLEATGLSIGTKVGFPSPVIEGVESVDAKAKNGGEETKRGQGESETEAKEEQHTPTESETHTETEAEAETEVDPDTEPDVDPDSPTADSESYVPLVRTRSHRTQAHSRTHSLSLSHVQSQLGADLGRAVSPISTISSGGGASVKSRSNSLANSNLSGPGGGIPTFAKRTSVSESSDVGSWDGGGYGSGLSTGYGSTTRAPLHRLSIPPPTRPPPTSALPLPPVGQVELEFEPSSRTSVKGKTSLEADGSESVSSTSAGTTSTSTAIMGKVNQALRQSSFRLSLMTNTSTNPKPPPSTTLPPTPSSNATFASTTMNGKSDVEKDGERPGVQMTHGRRRSGSYDLGLMQMAGTGSGPSPLSQSSLQSRLGSRARAGSASRVTSQSSSFGSSLGPVLKLKGFGGSKPGSGGPPMGPLPPTPEVPVDATSTPTPNWSFYGGSTNTSATLAPATSGVDGSGTQPAAGGHPPSPMTPLPTGPLAQSQAQAQSQLQMKRATSLKQRLRILSVSSGEKEGSRLSSYFDRTDRAGASTPPLLSLSSSIPPTPTPMSYYSPPATPIAEKILVHADESFLQMNTPIQVTVCPPSTHKAASGASGGRAGGAGGGSGGLGAELMTSLSPPPRRGSKVVSVTDDLSSSGSSLRVGTSDRVPSGGSGNGSLTGSLASKKRSPSPLVMVRPPGGSGLVSSANPSMTVTTPTTQTTVIKLVPSATHIQSTKPVGEKPVDDRDETSSLRSIKTASSTQLLDSDVESLRGHSHGARYQHAEHSSHQRHHLDLGLRREASTLTDATSPDEELYHDHSDDHDDDDQFEADRNLTVDFYDSEDKRLFSLSNPELVAKERSRARAIQMQMQKEQLQEEDHGRKGRTGRGGS